MNELIENYQFKGHSFQELIECFGLEQKQIRYGHRIADLEDGEFLEFRPLIDEEIEKSFYINGNKVTFTLTEQEEVELEKLRQYLWKNRGNPNVVEKVRVFLEILTEESEEDDYNYPVFNGILEVENDEGFIHWVIQNLEYMWS